MPAAVCFISCFFPDKHASKNELSDCACAMRRWFVILRISTHGHDQNNMRSVGSDEFSWLIVGSRQIYAYATMIFFSSRHSMWVADLWYDQISHGDVDEMTGWMHYLLNNFLYANFKTLFPMNQFLCGPFSASISALLWLKDLHFAFCQRIAFWKVGCIPSSNMLMHPFAHSALANLARITICSSIAMMSPFQ